MRPTEGSHSGLVRVPGKDVCRKAPRVRISHPPQERETVYRDRPALKNKGFLESAIFRKRSRAKGRSNFCDDERATDPRPKTFVSGGPEGLILDRYYVTRFQEG